MAEDIARARFPIATQEKAAKSPVWLPQRRSLREPGFALLFRQDRRVYGVRKRGKEKPYGRVGSGIVQRELVLKADGRVPPPMI